MSLIFKGNEAARAILGEDFILPSDVVRVHRVTNYTTGEVAALADSLPSVAVFNYLKLHGYAIMPTAPDSTSMQDLQRMLRDNSYPSELKLFAKQALVCNDSTSPGWLAIKKEPAIGSLGRAWKEQVGNLSCLSPVPNAAEMVWFVATYFMKHKVLLYKDMVLRTSSFGPEGDHVCLSGKDFRSLIVHDFRDHQRYKDVGLAVSYKLGRPTN